MIPTASLSLLSLIASALLAVMGWGSPLAVAHLAFAVGIVPLIFAAMSHFVPVLTRTENLPSSHTESSLITYTATWTDVIRPLQIIE